MTESERNKDAIRGMLAATDAGDLERVLSHYSPAYVDHDASEARDHAYSHFAALRPAFTAFYAAFTGTRHTIDDLVGEGDRVVARISAEAVHTSDLFGIPASGRIIRNESIAIYRFEHGKIVERWCRERFSTRDLLTGDVAPGR